MNLNICIFLEENPDHKLVVDFLTDVETGIGDWFAYLIPNWTNDVIYCYSTYVHDENMPNALLGKGEDPCQAMEDLALAVAKYYPFKNKDS